MATGSSTTTQSANPEIEDARRSSNLTTRNQRHTVRGQLADELRRVEERDGRRGAILAGLKAGLGVAAVLSILNGASLVRPVKGIEYYPAPSSAQYDDFIDQNSNPSVPSSGLTRVFSKSGLLYKETPDGVVSPFGSAVKSADYIIFIDANDSNKVKALNGTAGTVDYSGTDAGSVIQSAINALTNGGRVLLRAGTYTVNSTVTPTVSNVELCGEGDSTILAAKNGLNNPVIFVRSLSNWKIHDLQINGNRSNQTSNSTTCYGIRYLSTANCRVYDCYVHDCMTFGIAAEICSSVWIGNNLVVNCNANGINLFASTGGDVSNNIVNGASDNGISLSGGEEYGDQPGYDYTCSANMVSGINLGVSPYGLNTGHGIQIGDNGSVRRATVSGNTVESVAGCGVLVETYTGYTSYDIAIVNNSIYNSASHGVYTLGVTGVTISGNSIDTTGGAGVQFNTGTANVVLSGNAVSNTRSHGMFCTGSSPLTITGNVFKSIGAYGVYTVIAQSLIANNSFNTVTNCGIYVGAADCTVEGNLLGSVSGTGSAGIVLNIAGNNCVVIGNIIPTATIGIYVQANSCVVKDNQTAGTNSDVGVGNSVTGNAGWNPLNKINSMLNSTSNTIGTNGSTGTPAASTDYVVQGAPITVIWSGGSGVNVTIKDGGGNIVISSATSPQRLPYGWKINFGAFSAAPTLTTFGE